MRRRHSLFAATATALLLTASAASAQPVRIFDEAPPLELLRSIMIPESNGGQSRSIVIQKPDTGPSAVQRAATAVAPEPRVAPSAAAAAPRPATPRPAPAPSVREQAPDRST